MNQPQVTSAFIPAAFLGLTRLRDHPFIFKLFVALFSMLLLKSSVILGFHFRPPPFNGSCAQRWLQGLQHKHVFSKGSHAIDLPLDSRLGTQSIFANFSEAATTVL